MLKRIVSLLFAVAAILSVAAVAAGAEPVGPRLQLVSVNLKAGSVQGSGTVVIRSVDSESVAFVLTAAHVVENLRTVTEAIGDKGEKKQLISYRDVQAVQEVSTQTGDRIVGDTRLDGRIRSVDYNRDIALVQLRAMGTLKHSVTFYSGQTIPSAGTEIYHCGCPGGQDLGGTATLTSGIISRTGVRVQEFGGLENNVFDQCDAAGMGGSSGGMVCLRSTGEWIGMITLGVRAGDSFHWFVPIRNVVAFTKAAKCEWLIKDSPITNKCVDAIPIEVSPPRRLANAGSSSRPVVPPVPEPVTIQNY